MHRYLVVTVATICLGMSLTTAVRARETDWRAQAKQLKVQQKRERNALKMQQRSVKQSWKRARMDSATRAYSQHQMSRANRDMKLRQKDARQDLKDRQKSLKAAQRVYGR